MKDEKTGLSPPPCSFPTIRSKKVLLLHFFLWWWWGGGGGGGGEEGDMGDVRVFLWSLTVPLSFRAS